VLLVAWIAAATAAPAPPPPPPAIPLEQAQPIIVTGERVARPLRETPSSVVVKSEREIEAMSADRVDQVLTQIPNVTFTGGTLGPSIRGQDTSGPLQNLPAFLGGNRPRTTLVVDGRPVSYNEFVNGVAPAWDLERIEIFRSPQTTTRGQNSIAGAIIVESNAPTFEAQYAVRLIGGNLGTREVSALASGALSEQVAFRVAGDLRYSRTASDIFDNMAGADPNHDVYGLVRFRLLAKPKALPDSQLMLTYAHVQSQMPQTEGVKAPFRERRDPLPFYGVARSNVDSLTAVLRHQVTSSLVANTVFSAGDSEGQRLAAPGLGQSDVQGRDWSAESVFDWNPGGPLRMIGGASRTHQRLKQFIDLSLLTGIGRFHDSQDGTGLFGEAQITVAKGATLIAGLRYQRDRQRRTGALVTAGSSIDLDFDGKFHAWLPKASFSYDVSPKLRIGVFAQRAYNPGGTTLRFDTGQPDIFAAETLWDYELFARASLAGGALGLTSNFFYYDMRNAQRARPILIRPPNSLFLIGFADLFNVPRARSYGLEAEVRWKATDRLTLQAGVGLLDTKITRVDADSAAYLGKEFERSPHVTAAASIDWRPLKALRLSAQARHNSRYFSGDLDVPSLAIHQSTTVDARIEWESGSLTLFGYALNLFDDFAMTYLFAPNSGSANDPRRIGIGVEARF